MGGSYSAHLEKRRRETPTDPIDEHTVPVDKLLIGVPHGVAAPPNLDRLHHSRISKLAEDQVPVQVQGSLELVRFQTADEERLRMGQLAHQLLERFPELATHSEAFLSEDDLWSSEDDFAYLFPVSLYSISSNNLVRKTIFEEETNEHRSAWKESLFLSRKPGKAQFK